MNSNGDLLEEYNYDPCLPVRSGAKAGGRRRNPADWSYSNVPVTTYTNRGFTGHDHLDIFNLIDMLSAAKSRQRSSSGNGKIYDSEIARFLSPDPIIQDPYNILNYNRYSYCLNNPLKYIDPSGYLYNPGFNSRLWQTIENLWDKTPESEYTSYTSDGSGGWQVVRPGSGFKGENFPYLLGVATVAAKGPKKKIDPIYYFKETWNPDKRAGGYNNGSFTNGGTGSLDLINAVATGLKPIKIATTLAGVLLGATNMGLMASNNNTKKSYGDKARIAYNGLFIASDVFALGSGLALSILDSYGIFEYDYQQWDVLEKTDYWVYYNKWTGKWEKMKLPFLKKVLP